MQFLESAYKLFIKYSPLFLYGIRVTLLISLTGTVIGLLIGLVIGGIRAIKVEPRDPLWVKIIKKMIHFITGSYIEVFRGTPMMVQSMFLYYGFLRPVFRWNVINSGIFIVSINTGAYMAEIIRSGIQSVDNGQSEAARSIGMSSLQTMFYVILPQAIKNSFPSIGNEFVVNIKDTSVLNVIAVTELYFQSTKIAGTTFNSTTPFFVAAVIYFILTYTTTLLLKLVEKRLNRTVSSYPSSQTIPNHATLKSGEENETNN